MWITINKHEQDTWLQRLICVDHRKEPIKQKMTKIEAATKAIVIYNTIKRGDWILIEYSTIGVQTLTTGQRLTHCTVQDWNNHNHNHAESNKCIAPIDWHDNWLSRVLRLHQHNIGYMADGFFYRSDDPTILNIDLWIPALLCMIPGANVHNRIHYLAFMGLPVAYWCSMSNGFSVDNGKMDTFCVGVKHNKQ